MNELNNHIVDVHAKIKGDNKGIVFNIQRYSLHDGPGIRSIVFLKGCPLACAWCSNPESQKTKPEVGLSKTLCKQCLKCVEVCPSDASAFVDGKVTIDRKACTICGTCIDACVHDARKLYGEEKTALEVYKDLAKDATFYQDSGGGVTASGGEPLMQPVFLASIFKLCQFSGFHTAIETTGCVKTEAFEVVKPYTDLLLFDIKFAGSDLHKKWTRQPNNLILDNLKFVVDNGMKVTVRVPMIPGINDTDEELKEIAEMVVKTLKEPRVNLLPYHRYGEGKYDMLNREYDLSNLTRQTDEKLERAKQIFTSLGIETEVIG